MDEVNKVHRDWIEDSIETSDPTPSPGYEQVQETADEVRQEAIESGEAFSQGEDIPPQDVPASERLDRPVGTESDSY